MPDRVARGANALIADQRIDALLLRVDCALKRRGSGWGSLMETILDTLLRRLFAVRPPPKKASLSETFKNVGLGLAGLVSTVVIPVVGLHYTNKQKEEEVSKDLIKISVDVLSAEAREDSQPLRRWAIDTINFYAEVKLPPDAEDYLLEQPITPVPGGISPKVLDELSSEGFTLGVALSRHNAGVDFSALRQRKVNFAFIRVSQGEDSKDSAAETHIVKAAESGMKIGLYHFFTPSGDLSKQYANFSTELKNKSWQLAPVIDAEDMPSQSVDDKYADRLFEFANDIERDFGIKPIIYTTRVFADAHMDERFSKFPLFIARFTMTSEGKPSLPKWWQSYVFWHFTDRVSDPFLKSLDVVAFSGAPEELKSVSR
jgi:GH25 family lysozyme M1 (1,4-beta-N-acetylmuramidase)